MTPDETPKSVKFSRTGIGQWSHPTSLYLKRDGVWAKIPKVAPTVPWGYSVDPNNSNVLVPIDICLDTLEEGRKHLKTHTQREVCNWISTRSGYPITKVILQRRVANAKRRENYAQTLKRWAAKAEEALEAARYIEECSIDTKKRIKVPTIKSYYARQYNGELEGCIRGSGLSAGLLF
jgi:hypothetical protein